jgi:hypothetical protein
MSDTTAEPPTRYAREAMAVVRLANGDDLSVKLTVREVITKLNVPEEGPKFIELPGEDGPFLVRPEAVLAVIADQRRGAAGFRVAQGAEAS